MEIDSFTMASPGDPGMAFQFGHEVHPLSTLRQALWFHLLADNGRGGSHGRTYYWLEACDGHLWALEFTDLAGAPDDYLPQLGAVVAMMGCAHGFQERLESAWLFPPFLKCRVVTDGPVVPAVSLVQDSMSELLALAGVQGEMKFEQDELAEDPYFESEVDAESEASGLPDEIAAWERVVQGFHERLEAETVVLLAGYERGAHWRTDSLDNYNTCIRWPTRVRRYRYQALMAFPWLWEDFGLSFDGGDMFFARKSVSVDQWGNIPHAATVDAVDSGLALLPVLARRYGVAQRTLKNARACLAANTADPRLITPLIRLLDEIKPDKLPVSRHDLAQVVSVVEWLTGLGLSQDEDVIREISSTLFRDGVASGFRTLGGWCPHHGVSPLSGSNDFLNRLYEQAAQRGVRLGARGDVVKAWFRVHGIQDYFQTSDLWHEYIQPGPALPLNMVLDWPPILKRPIRLGGRTFHELQTSSQLEQEGNAMGHCVASRTSACACGESLVLSLRSENDERQSTLEIGVDAASGYFIREHKSRDNGAASALCEASALLMLNYLNEHKRKDMAARKQDLEQRMDILRQDTRREWEANPESILRDGLFDGIWEHALDLGTG